MFVSEFCGFISCEDNCLLRCDTVQFGLLVSEFDELPAAICKIDLEDGGNRFIRSVCSVFCQTMYTLQCIDVVIWPLYLW